jgi:glycosyltransferase involved in cell wall biosynthesis
MRIVLVYDQLQTGGTEKLVVMIANLLHEHHHDVTVVIIRQPSSLDKFIHPAIPVVYLNRKNKFGLRPMKTLADTCRRADVVHIHTYYNWRYVYSAVLFFKLQEPRFVLHEHSDMKNINAVDKLILPKLDAFIAVNQMQAAIAETIGMLSSRIFMLPNVIRSLRTVLTSAKRHNRMMMVGNIRPEKNYELALDVFRLLPATISLDIYGNINDRSYFEALQQRIQDNGLDGRVNIITNETDVPQHYAKYDLALHTASNETGPLVVFEYLSAGMPFLCSMAGQSPQNIKPMLPEIIVQSYDVNDWVLAIKNFLQQSNSDRELLLNKMKDVAGTLLDINKYYESLIQVYAA